MPTKASLMRQAASITTALKTFREDLLRNPHQEWRDLFNNNVYVAMPGDGTAYLQDDVNIQTLQKSAHSRLELQIWKNEITEKAQELAKAFYTMFPGQPLTWKMEPGYQESETRHLLMLGCRPLTNHTRIPHVIDTVISRWKAPLVRLAQYIGHTTKTPPTRVFLFNNTEMFTQHTGVCGRIMMHAVPAQDLEQAYKLYTFTNASTKSTPAPSTIEASFLAEVNTPTLPFDLTNQDVSTRTEPVNRPSEMPLAIQQEAATLQETINSLYVDYSISIVLNVINATSKVNFKTHPMAHPQDVADTIPLREAIEKSAQSLATLLTQMVADVYPTAKNGKVFITKHKIMSTKGSQTSWHCTLDGFQATLGSRHLDMLKTGAIALQQAQTSAEDTLYGIMPISDHRMVDVNTQINCVVVKASTPEHAWAIYHSPRNNQKIQGSTKLGVYTLEPTRWQKALDTREEAHKAIGNIY